MEGNFKKRPHRPWNMVLEKTLNIPKDLKTPTNDIREELNLRGSHPPPKITTNDNSDDRKIDFKNLSGFTVPEPTIEPQNNLEAIIANKTAQKEKLLRTLNTEKSGPMLIGGFLQPDYMTPNSEGTGKVKKIMSDLKVREQELNNLASNLKLSQALDQVEKLETAKNIAEQAKNAAEERLKQAIEQAQIAVRQFHIAIEKAQCAEEALKEEESLRHNVEQKYKETEMKLHSLQATLLAEQGARQTAEEKAQHALNQIVQIELARQEIDKEKKIYEQQALNLMPELKKMEAKQVTLEQKILALTDEKNALEKKIEELQKINLEQTINLKDFAQEEQKIQSLKQQMQQLESIVVTEKKLRIIAEQKAKESLHQAAAAEMARQAEEKQRKIFDERAKRAINHANKTVMHFLNAPIDYDIEEQLKDLQPIEQ